MNAIGNYGQEEEYLYSQNYLAWLLDCVRPVKQDTGEGHQPRHRKSYH
ncbi:MAG: hypothetical protein HYY80_00835 [Chloroflexi bacterium]|nr:hypothetical protein [Chloroflexota bacterium]